MKHVLYALLPCCKTVIRLTLLFLKKRDIYPSKSETYVTELRRSSSHSLLVICKEGDIID